MFPHQRSLVKAFLCAMNMVMQSLLLITKEEARTCVMARVIRGKIKLPGIMLLDRVHIANTKCFRVREFVAPDKGITLSRKKTAWVIVYFGADSVKDIAEYLVTQR